MKLLTFVLSCLLLMSCATPDRKFSSEKTCSNESLNYIKKNQRSKKFLFSPALTAALQETQTTMQGCYEAYRARTGKEEFNTCLVVGVNGRGRTEYFEFSSKEVQLDKEFIKCAHTVTKKLQYGKHGTNYVMLQSYQFYYQ